MDLRSEYKYKRKKRLLKFNQLFANSVKTEKYQIEFAETK